MWIALIALTVGVVIGVWMPYTLTPDMAPYIAIAIVAALDSVFGGIAAYMTKKFDILIFFTGFFSNVLLAAGLVYMGNIIGINLMLAAIVIFGSRMFQNFAIMRHEILGRYTKKERENYKKNVDRKALHRKARTR